MRIFIYIYYTANNNNFYFFNNLYKYFRIIFQKLKTIYGLYVEDIFKTYRLI